MSGAGPEPVGDASVLFDLTGRVAIVTGASSGIGARFARLLTHAGARVVLAARRADQLAKVAADCAGSVPVVCDVTRPEDRERLVTAALDHFGTPDVLVNNAGVSSVGRAEDEPWQDFARVVEVNLVATFALSQLVARPMLERRAGSIVNVASVYGLVGSGSLPQAGYTAGKGGVVNLTRELAAQWAPAGVRVNAICPGWFRTELTADQLDSEKGRQWVLRRTPMRREGAPHELDGALLFLASDASSYVTGTALAVDGGYLSV